MNNRERLRSATDETTICVALCQGLKAKDPRLYVHRDVLPDELRARVPSECGLSPNFVAAIDRYAVVTRSFLDPMLQQLLEGAKKEHFAAQSMVAAILRQIPGTHRAWLRVKEEDPSVKHPIAPLILSYWELPQPVEHDTRKDMRILPADRARGVSRNRHSVPFLDSYYKESEEKLRVVGKSKAVPLALRMLIFLFLSIKIEHRGMRAVRLTMTVDELLDGMWGTETRRNANRYVEYWPALKKSLWNMHNIVVPTNSGDYVPLRLHRLPPKSTKGVIPKGCDLVSIDIENIPAFDRGPIVDYRQMQQLWTLRKTVLYAFVAGHVMTWKKVKNKKGRWVTSVDAEKYPVVSMEELRYWVFGEGTRTCRSKDALEAWHQVEQVYLECDTAAKTEDHGYRVLPAVLRKSKEEDTGREEKEKEQKKEKKTVHPSKQQRARHNEARKREMDKLDVDSVREALVEAGGSCPKAAVLLGIRRIKVVRAGFPNITTSPAYLLRQWLQRAEAKPVRDLVTTHRRGRNGE